MKKVIALIAAFSMLGILIYPCKSVAAVVDIDHSILAETKPNLEEICELLTDFIEQRGYKAHAEVADEFENTVTVVFEQLPIGAENYDFDALTADFNAFFAEKQIDTDSFGFLVLADEGGAVEPEEKMSLEEIRDLLAGYIEQRGYKARAEVADEFKNTVTVVFEQLPIGAENYDFDALTADFNAFFAEKQIDTDSFGFLVLADEGGAVEPEEKMSLEEIRDLLAGYIEQRGYKARAEVADEFENTVTVVFEQLPIGAENYDFDALTADFNAFFAEKQIDTDSFGFLVLADEGGAVEPEEKMSLEEIRDLLAGYIEQRGYKARAEVADEFENTVTVVFEQLPIGAENYDFDALTADFNAFFAENQINTDAFDFLVLADEGKTDETSTDPKQSARISDEQLLSWVIIDYEKKTGIAAYPEIISYSDDEYSISVKDKDGNALDTYTIDPKTGIGTNASSAEVNLPQTGFSDVHKAVTGLAALMGIVGFVLFNTSRKER